MSKRRARAARPTIPVHALPGGYSNAAFLAAVVESAPAVAEAPERVVRQEATLGGATVTSNGRLLCRIIRAGWSLNGNYWSADVLRRDGPTAWPKGTQAYANHAPPDEEEKYPSGRIEHLAAVLTTDAWWDEKEQALFAEAQVFPRWRETILGIVGDDETRNAIGMSIRAWVTVRQGEAEGREGEIIESIPEGRSVDFVTVPAAGGGIVSVLEAVGHQPVAEARNCGHWFESRIHASFTEIADRMFGEGYLSRDERITLSGAVGDALAAFAARLETDAPHLYDRDPYAEPASPMVAPTAEAMTTLPDPQPEDGEPTAPNPDVTDGAPPAAPNPPTEEEPAMSGTETGAPPVQAGTAEAADIPVTSPQPTVAPGASHTPPVDVSAIVQQAVATALAPIQQALAAQTERADRQDAENRRLRNTNRASEAVSAALRAPALGDVAAQIGPRVTGRVLAAIPTADDGSVDETALGEAITAAIEDESTYLRSSRAEALEAAGVGQPYGLGGSTAVEEAPNDGLDAALDGLFKSIGLSDAQTAVALKGRN